MQGHEFSPVSNFTTDAIQNVDYYVGCIVDRMTDKMRDNVDVIIVSDHGMSVTPRDKTVFLDDYGVHLIAVDNLIAGKTPAEGVDGWQVTYSPILQVQRL